MLLLCSNPPMVFQLTQNKNQSSPGGLNGAHHLPVPLLLVSHTSLTLLQAHWPPCSYCDVPGKHSPHFFPLPTIFSTQDTHMAPSPPSRFCSVRLFLVIVFKITTTLPATPSFPALLFLHRALHIWYHLPIEVGVCLSVLECKLQDSFFFVCFVHYFIPTV